ncbi:uncharacterized protein LOC125904316 [Epinephelus fuscoguttatus]|uniref:uncharacterized protein LOC125904316 n=1 Tax=Epinephelus fuscoguttatus TaxID=293821 RepID=UPI0020D03BBF|nr:uncharacterized protein LOC125904316 [Epinephelus fuscoguttatus]
MNLWISSHLLVAGLLLSTSALTPEECQSLVTPLSLADRSTMYGRWNFITGYTDNEVYNTIGRLTESTWMNITPSPSNPNEVVVSQEDKINGTCITSVVNITIDGNTLSSSYFNITSEFYLLPSCDSCLLMSVNSTARNLDKLLQMMNFSSNVTGDKINARALYLNARESTLQDSDLEHFKQQASCLGFSREPDILYDPKNEFCAEGEGIKMSIT